MALTTTFIDHLKPKANRYTVSDGHGLTLEVLPSGNRSWRYRYRHQGKLEKVSLGQYPTLSLKAARTRRNAYAELLANGISPAKQKQVEKRGIANNTTVLELGEKYFSEIVTRDCKDPSNSRRYLDKDIYPTLADRPLRDVTSLDIQALVFRKRDGGHPAAAAQLRNLLKRLFEYAMALGLVSVNPALSLPMRFITQVRTRDRALSPEELKTYLYKLYQSNIRRQFKLALHIILLTLVRKGELLHARWENVDFEAGEWRIPANDSKTGKPHIVYLTRQTALLFRELRILAGPSQLVLPGRGSLTRPFALNALNKALDGIAFGLPPFTIHDLRRTGSTLLHEQGFPSDVIEKSLNHTIGGVRGIYNRAQYAEQRRHMLQCWADYVEQLATESSALITNFGGNAARGEKP